MFTSGFLPTLQGRAVRNDFAVYYVAALELRSGIDPYRNDFANFAKHAGLEIRDVRESTEPPLFLILLQPLTHLPVHTAFWIWQTINFVSLAGALILLLGSGAGLSGPLSWTLAALAFMYPPVLSHFWYGQSKLPILLMLILMAQLMTRGFDGAAGLVLSFAGLLRVYPFAIAGYLVLERRWRALAYMGIGVIVGGTAMLALAGRASCLSFLHGLSYLTTDQWMLKSGDNAPLAFVVRALHDSGLHKGVISRCAEHAVLVAIDITVLVFAVRATLLRPARTDKDLSVFALWVASAIVLPPVSWDYDMTLLLFPFAILASVATRVSVGKGPIIMAVGSYLLIGIWRFSGIGDAEQVTGAAANILKETATFALLTGFLSAYWLAISGTTGTLVPVCAVPAEIWRRLNPAN